eukprot:GHVP01066882.1.p1 GENE.GHVP01066882.1~~GHVP01066882.1.p1  ORF type:complete len:464 (+),score=95.14 GHVP01066882.1:1248-2639(+)
MDPIKESCWKRKKDSVLRMNAVKENIPLCKMQNKEEHPLVKSPILGIGMENRETREDHRIKEKDKEFENTVENMKCDIEKIKEIDDQRLTNTKDDLIWLGDQSMYDAFEEKLRISERNNNQKRFSFCGELDYGEGDNGLWRLVGKVKNRTRRQTHSYCEGPTGNDAFERKLSRSFEQLHSFPDPLSILDEENTREKKPSVSGRPRSMSCIYTMPEEINIYTESSDKYISNKEMVSDKEENDIEDNTIEKKKYSPPKKSIPVTPNNEIFNYPGGLFIVEFKKGRFDIFYLSSNYYGEEPKIGSYVLVEADRGTDFGKVVRRIDIKKDDYTQRNNYTSEYSNTTYDTITGKMIVSMYRKGDLAPKRILTSKEEYNKDEAKIKEDDELIATTKCQERVYDFNINMEIVDSEYQWDRNKLTFYYKAGSRVDFRELVRELFRSYKTRIWMCSVANRKLPCSGKKDQGY